MLSKRIDFAFETTLSSRSFIGFIKKARQSGYTVNLIYYWLDSVELAIERVQTRVSEGGHDVPQNVIIRRYYAGLKNLLTLYRQISDYWLLIDNSQTKPEVIAEGRGSEILIQNAEQWDKIKNTI